MASIAGIGAAIALNAIWSWSTSDDDPQVAWIVANTIGIDTHKHVDVPLDKAELSCPVLPWHYRTSTGPVNCRVCDASVN